MFSDQVSMAGLYSRHCETRTPYWPDLSSTELDSLLRLLRLISRARGGIRKVQIQDLIKNW